MAAFNIVQICVTAICDLYVFSHETNTTLLFSSFFDAHVALLYAHIQRQVS